MPTQPDAHTPPKTPMDFRRVWAIAIICVVVAIALLVAFPALAVYAVHLANFLLTSAGSYLPFVPLVMYLVLGIIIHNHLLHTPNEQLAESLDKEQGFCLTLAAFSFAVLSFLLPYFKDEFKQGHLGPAAILKYFAIALGCFVAGFMALRYRGRNLFKFLAEAFLDNGLWCIFAGFWAFFTSEPALKSLSYVITGVIIVYSLYLVLNFTYHFRAYRHVQAPAATVTA